MFLSHKMPLELCLRNTITITGNVNFQCLVSFSINFQFYIRQFCNAANEFELVRYVR